VITDLFTGGAERQLVELLARLHPLHISAKVVSLSGPGSMSEEISKIGIHVEHLMINESLAFWPKAMARIALIARRFQPDLIQGWMYHGNLGAFLAYRFWPRSKVLFSIRQSLYDIGKEKKMTGRVIHVNAKLSNRCAAVIYNSFISCSHHENIGFARDKSMIVPNGFDVEKFHPDEEARVSVRKEIGVSPDALLIGFISRYHPLKGHDVFFKAARLLAERRSNVHFLLAGKGVVATSPPFSDWLKHPQYSSVINRFHLLGERKDIPRLTAALDIATLPSLGEAFPNVVGEAMSCAVPCVATAVGDVPRILGDTGIIIPPLDVNSLVKAWEYLLALPVTERRRLGKSARNRIVSQYAIDSVVEKYVSIYEKFGGSK